MRTKSKYEEIRDEALQNIQFMAHASWDGQGIASGRRRHMND